MTHSAMVKIGVDEKTGLALLVLRCVDCGGDVVAFQVPVVHLATIANACHAAAEKLGVASVMEHVASCTTAELSDDAAEEKLDRIRRKARLN
jgi:hypothetical protein